LASGCTCQPNPDLQSVDFFWISSKRGNLFASSYAFAWLDLKMLAPSVPEMPIAQQAPRKFGQMEGRHESWFDSDSFPDKRGESGSRCR
jgi:hypothetical protein